MREATRGLYRGAIAARTLNRTPCSYARWRTVDAIHAIFRCEDAEGRVPWHAGGPGTHMSVNEEVLVSSSLYDTGGVKVG